MMLYEIPFERRQHLAESVDAVYHSSSWQDMWMKIDLLGLVFDLDAFMMLCDTLCYHYGFWDHTKPRFLAFKKLLKLKRDNPLSKIKHQKKTLEAVKLEFESHETAMWLNPINRTPGRRAETRAWKSILNVLERCQAEELEA